jgi:hypothetical protein
MERALTSATTYADCSLDPNAAKTMMAPTSKHQYDSMNPKLIQLAYSVLIARRKPPGGVSWPIELFLIGLGGNVVFGISE